MKHKFHQISSKMLPLISRCSENSFFNVLVEGFRKFKNGMRNCVCKQIEYRHVRQIFIRFPVWS